MRYRSSKPVLHSAMHEFKSKIAASHNSARAASVANTSQQFVAAIGSLWTTATRSNYLAEGVSIRGL